MSKILYLGPIRFPEGDAAASRVLNNSRLFRQLGHEVEILSFGGIYREVDKINDRYCYDGFKYKVSFDIDTHSWKERILRYIYPYPYARKLIKEAISNYDILITYNTPFHMNIFLQHICRKYNKKLILDLTEWPDSNESPGGKYFPIYWISEINMRYIQKHFKNIIPISSFLDDYYKGINSLLLPPLINIKDKKWNFFSEINEPNLRSFEGLRIIYAGTPGKKDLLDNAIQAIFNLIKKGYKIQLIVLGVSYSQAKRIYSEEIFRDCSKNFMFLGRLPQIEIPSYYNISDFSVLIRRPSRKNKAGFPTKMAESMAAGCPVILNYTSDLERYAVDKVNAIVVNDYSVKSIEEGLFQILNYSKEQITSMKNSARKTGELYFDYRSYEIKAKTFFDNLR